MNKDENNTLPKSWAKGQLNDIVCSVKTGIGEYKGSKNYYSTGSINNHSSVPTGCYTFQSRPSRANRISHINDVFQARMKETSKALLIDEGLAGELFSTGFIQIRPYSDTYYPKLLYYFIQSNDFLHQRDELATGSTQEALTDRNSKKLLIPLPPLNEQKRIAAKLDKIIPKINVLRKRLDLIPQIIKRFRQSVLTAAVTGKLTEKWRKKHKLNIKWEYTILEKIIIEGPQNGLYKPQKFYGSGYLIVRIDNFYDGVINSWDTVKRIELNKNELKTYALQNGNIIINRVNSMTYLGKSALVRNLSEECVFESNMMRIKINLERGNPEYLIKYLNSQQGLNVLRKNAKHAVNQSSINQQDVKAVIIPLPPLEEQREIVRQINKLFAFADKLEAHYNKAKGKIDKLPRSVLAKTFRGELVPQNPNDEPASELLKRIIAEKEKRRAEIKKTKKRNVKSTAQKKGN